MVMKIGVVGAGSWGTTLALYLNQIGHRVTLWVFERELYEIMKLKRVNEYYLPNKMVDKKIRITNSLQEVAEGNECLLMVVPSHVFRDVLMKIKPHIRPHQILISATKGIENYSLMTMSQVVHSVMDHSLFAVLSGPSFAKEVAEGLPTAITIAARDIDLATHLQGEFSSERFRCYAHDDVIGAEIGGAVKNVIAIAAGICDGLGYGENARAALITRGLAETIRLGIHMGADPMTFTGLSGLGDLVLTCSGNLSRNKRVGIRLGKGETLDEIQRDMKEVAEGVRTAKSVRLLAERHSIDMPITEQVYLVLYKGKDPQAAMVDLMTRALKREIAFPQAAKAH